MSAVVARPSAAIFREEQSFAWWLYAGLGVLFLVAAASVNLPPGWRPSAAPLPFRLPTFQAPVSIALGLGLPTFLVVCFLHMTTEVGPEACCVTFGWVPTYRHSIRLDDVVGVEIVAYRAIREHGFWGIRTMPSGERVLTARGNQAVRVFLRDGRCVLIGTQRPEELARALGSRCA